MAVQNAENGVVRGHSRSRAMPPFDKSAYDFLLYFNRNCVTLLPFLIYSRLFVESRRFWPIPPAFGVPIRVAPVKFRGDLWGQKTRLPGLSCGVVYVILRLAVLVEHRLVTDRHGHRPMANTTHAQHRAVKTWQKCERINWKLPIITLA